MARFIQLWSLEDNEVSSGRCEQGIDQRSTGGPSRLPYRTGWRWNESYFEDKELGDKFKLYQEDGIYVRYLKVFPYYQYVTEDFLQGSHRGVPGAGYPGRKTRVCNACIGGCSR